MGSCVPGTWISVALRFKIYVGRGYTNFYNHRTKGSHKSMHLPNILVGTSARQVIEDLEISSVGVRYNSILSFSDGGSSTFAKNITCLIFTKYYIRYRGW